MLRRLAPLLTTLLTVLLDTAVIPVFYTGRFLVPLSLVVVILIGIQLGRTSGMLYGMIAGLLLDISTGSIGMKFFPYIAIGFLIGFLLDQQPEIHRGMERIDRIHIIAIRLIWIIVLVVINEIVMLVIQYFNTAMFKWSYVGTLLLRSVLTTLLAQLLYPLTRVLYRGRKKAAGGNRSTREVKNF
ncbi:MAG: ECF transporter S component [Clostridia bacterium]|nr:ECF transporter S component [Clostridia bacterium]